MDQNSVIAYGRGGALETVIENKTGIFFGSSAEFVGKKVELYLLEQVSKGLTVSLAFKCLAGLQPFFTPATVLKQPVKSSICLFRYEGEKYQVILGMQNLGNRRHYSIYVVPRS